MPDNIDSLQIEISANAQKADKALDNLAKSLSKLSSTLGGLQTSKFYQLADGMQKFASSMTGLNNAVKAQDFTRIATGLNKIAGINASGLRSAAVAMQGLSKSLNNISFISFDSQGIANMANAISLLGRKTITQAAANIPQLTASLQGLVSGMNSIGTIKFDVSGLAQLTSSISKLGGKTATNAVPNIQKLAVALKNMMQILSTAPRVSQNLIQMTQALAQLAANGTRAGTATRSLASSFNIFSSSAKNARKHTFSLASAFGKFYATWFLLIRGIGLFKDAIDISSDLQEVQNVVDVTFGDMAYKVEDLASHSIEDFGMSELTAKKIASRFQAMGTAMGFTQERMSDMSVTLTELAADMASFYNVEQEDVAKSLQSIFTGETEPMRQYGIDLTNATVQQWALNNGIKANMSTMTNAEKTLLRYQYTLEASSAAAGDFARTSDSWANSLRVLTQSFQALGAIVGEVLINAFKPFIRALNSVMQSVINFARTIANALGNIFGWTYEVSGGGLTDDFEGAASGAGDLDDNLGGAANNAKKLKDYVLGIDELNIISPDDEADSGSGAGGGVSGGGTGDAGGGEWVKTDGMLDRYKSEIDSLYELGQYIGKVLTDAMNSIDWNKVYSAAADFGIGLANFLNGLISPDLFGALGRTIAGALNTALHFLDSFGSTFDWSNFGFSLAVGVNEFFRSFDFNLLANTINTWAHGILDAIIKFLETVNWKQIGAKIGDFIADIDWEGILAKAAEAIGEALSGLLDVFIAFNESDGEGISEAIKLIADAFILFKVGSVARNALTFLKTNLPFFKQFGIVTAGIVLVMTGFEAFDQIKEDIEYIQKNGLTNWQNKNREESPFSPWNIYGHDATGVGGVQKENNAYNPYENMDYSWLEEWKTKLSEWQATNREKRDAEKAEFDVWFDNLGSSFSTFIGDVKSFWSEKWDGVSTWFKTNVQPWFTKEKWSELWNNVSGAIQEKWSEIVGWWDSSAIGVWWNENVAPWFTAERWMELFNNILLGFQNIWTTIVEWWNGTAIVTWWNENVMPWFTLERWIALLQPVLIGFQTKFQEIFNFVSNIWNRLNTFTNSIWTTIKNFLFNTFTNVKAKVVEIWTYFWDFISTKWTHISENTSELWTSIKDFLSTTFENIKTNIVEKWNYFLEFIRTMWTNIFNKTSELWNKIKTFLSEIFTRIRENIVEKWNYFFKFIGEKWDKIKEKTNEIWDKIKEFLFETIEKIKSEIDEKVEAIGTFWDDTFGAMWTTVETVFTNIKEKIGSVIDWAKEKIDSLREAISNLIDRLNPFNGGSGGVSVSLSGYASGGFPERGELFMARENGMTEMVGSFGARTAVANNDQIVAGIATGVRAAVAEVVIPYLDDLVTSNREIAAKDVSVNIGDRAIAQANVRGQKSLGAQLRTV